MLADQVPIPDLVIYLQAKLETLKKRTAKMNVAFEDRVSHEYLEVMVHAYEHFFFRYKSSGLLVIDTSEIDFATGASICRNSCSGRASRSRARSIFCRLDPHPRTETVVSE